MDEAPNSGKDNRKKTQANGKKSSATVTRRTADASPSKGLPPFDETDVEPVNNDDILKEKKTSEGHHDNRRSASTAEKGATGARRSASHAKSSSASAKHSDKMLPAEIARRAQPYVILGLGILLAIMLLLSALMSGFVFDHTSATHPFRLVGYYAEYFLFGLLGCGAFLMPVLMIYLSVEQLRRGEDYRSGGRGLVSLGIIVLLSAMVHTCMIDAGGVADTWAISELYALGAVKLGGGVLGGLLGKLCHVGLGVIGTMVVGVMLMAALVMLLFRLTPRAVWQWVCRVRKERAERAEAARKAREEQEAKAAKKAKELPVLAPASGSRQMRVDDLDDVQEQEEPLPELKPVRKKKKEEKADVGESIDYLDPTRALLGKTDGRAKKKDNDEPYGGNPSTVFEDEAVSAPIEQVNELSLDEIEAMERSFASSSVARTIAPEEEPVHEIESQEMVSYPDRVELDMDAESGVVTPLEAPMDDEFEESAEEPEALDCHDGFDYSMESSEQDDLDDVVDEDGAQIIGGVAVKVERLSDEERERGELIAEDTPEEIVRRPYTYPTVDLLNEPKANSAAKDQEIRAKMQKLRETLTNFRVRIEGISYACGPSVTRYEVRPAPGVRVRSIANLADDIAMSLAAKSIRIEAPIPGKDAVGIEVPNTTRETVYLRRLIDSEDFSSRPSKLTACLGEDVAGAPILFDIVKMPHLLVAGTTGSGKSVSINDFIISLLYKASPDEVKIILIDPKQVEFTVYKDMPHLMAPIVCDPKRAAAALNLAVMEMEKRFQMIREVGVRDIAGYNAITENDRYEHPYMPQIVIIIDELADLMMQARDEVENSIVRLAQKARAAGMHLIIGTQRPSVDVITGLIKANIPSRIACTVKSQVDSRTILDIAGAEKLLGMGDMLYAPIGSPKPLRVQGAFVSDGEVERVVEFIKRNNDPVRYDQEFLDNLDREAQMIGQKRTPDMDDDMDEGSSDGHDPKFYEALRVAVDNNRISTSLLQRMLSIGYGRAAKIIDDMERLGFVGPAVGNKPREIRITKEAYAELIMNKEE